MRYIVEEVLREVPGIACRRMFGGWGIYKDGVFFALIDRGRLYFRVDERTLPNYQRMGSQPFVYSGPQGKPMTMNYWELPAEVMDNPYEVSRWVEGAYMASLREKKRKK